MEWERRGGERDEEADGEGKGARGRERKQAMEGRGEMGGGWRWREMENTRLEKKSERAGRAWAFHCFASRKKMVSGLSHLITLVGDKLTLLSSKCLVRPNPVAAIEHGAMTVIVIPMTFVNLQFVKMSSKSFVEFN
jgi:hypothetical protein